MHGHARMRLIGVINIIWLVNLLKNKEMIKLYKYDFIHALCLIETSNSLDLGSYDVLLETNYNLWA